MTKVESLYGTTPAEIFQSGIENIDQIEAIALAVKWRDGTVTAEWSNIDARELAHMLFTLDEKYRRDHFD